jgi:hypothetical protein
MRIFGFHERIALESSTEIETYGYPVARPRSGGSAVGSRPPIPSSGGKSRQPLTAPTKFVKRFKLIACCEAGLL